MITRLWRGWTTVDNADAYERFLLGDLFPSMREIPGFRGADVLRRLEHDEVAFITLTRFDSLAAIKAFASVRNRGSRTSSARAPRPLRAASASLRHGNLHRLTPTARPGGPSPSDCEHGT